LSIFSHQNWSSPIKLYPCHWKNSSHTLQHFLRYFLIQLIKSFLVIGFVLADELNEALRCKALWLLELDLFRQVKLDISLFEVVIMDLDFATDLLSRQINYPLRYPLSSPVILERQVHARYVDVQLLVFLIQKYCVLCCVLSELSVHISIELFDDIIS